MRQAGRRSEKLIELIATLPMYDWPERRDQVDAEWDAFRRRLHAGGVDAPATLVRRNADMPAVPGGIRSPDGAVVSADPATLPPDELDYPVLWRHPALLFGQTCWGPLEATDLAEHVSVVGQPDYSGIEGGRSTLYSSAIVMRGAGKGVPAPADDGAVLPLDGMRGLRFAYNDPHSMSGMIGLSRDLAAKGADLSIFPERTETGGHRLSIRAIAEGSADIATIDCRSWQLAQEFEPAAGELTVVGWTARRPGLPFIAARALAGPVRSVLAIA